MRYKLKMIQNPSLRVARFRLLKLKPPAGEAWSGHSHRSGGASGALSIDVSLPAIARFGVWSQIHSLYPYLDPSVPGFFTGGGGAFSQILYLYLLAASDEGPAAWVDPKCFLG